jgi:hypothetical protein
MGWDIIGHCTLNCQNATISVKGTFAFNTVSNQSSVNMQNSTWMIDNLAFGSGTGTFAFGSNPLIVSGQVNGTGITFTGSGTIIGGTVTGCRFETGMTFTNVTLGENVVVNGTATVTGTTNGSLTATRVNVQSSNAAALALTATDIYVCTTAAVNLTGSTGAIHLLAPGLPYTVASGLTVDALIPLGVIEVG